MNPYSKQVFSTPTIQSNFNHMSNTMRNKYEVFNWKMQTINMELKKREQFKVMYSVIKL